MVVLIYSILVTLNFLELQSLSPKEDNLLLDSTLIERSQLIKVQQDR